MGRFEISENRGQVSLFLKPTQPEKKCKNGNFGKSRKMGGEGLKQSFKKEKKFLPKFSTEVNFLVILGSAIEKFLD